MTLKIDNVSFAYNKENVIKDVSLEIDRNQLVGLVGLSGGGKTTLLKLLSGLLYPKDGKITYNDLPTVVKNKRNQQLFKQVGVVFQDFQLFDTMNVLENVALPYRLKNNVSISQANEKARQQLTAFGCENIVDQYPYQCSGGQKQRIALARALILEPSTLLIDEPTSALDKENTLLLISMLKQLNENGLTIVVITHDLFFAELLCNRIIELKDGEIVSDMETQNYFMSN